MEGTGSLLRKICVCQIQRNDNNIDVPPAQVLKLRCYGVHRTHFTILSIVMGSQTLHLIFITLHTMMTFGVSFLFASCNKVKFSNPLWIRTTFLSLKNHQFKVVT